MLGLLVAGWLSNWNCLSCELGGEDEAVSELFPEPTSAILVTFRSISESCHHLPFVRVADRKRALSCEPGCEGEAVSEFFAEPILVTFRSLSEL